MGRFINADAHEVLILPKEILGSKNFFSYCDNNPVIRTDPTGMWFGLDDLIAGSVGIVVCLGGQVISDIVSSAINRGWSFSSFETYVGAGVGGAAGGIGTLYAGPIAGAAISGGVTTLVGQGLEKLTGVNNRNLKEIVANTVIDSAVGATMAEIMPGVNEITKGRNSYNAVYKSGLTKLKNETAKQMSPKVILKGATAGLTSNIAMDIYIGARYSKPINNIVFSKSSIKAPIACPY